MKYAVQLWWSLQFMTGQTCWGGKYSVKFMNKKNKKATSTLMAATHEG